MAMTNGRPRIVPPSRLNEAIRTRKSIFPARIIGSLGIAQIFLGFLAILLQIVAIVTSESTSVLIAGIWTGGVFIVSGGIAVTAARRILTVWRSFSVMAINVLAMLASVALLAVAVIGVNKTTPENHYNKYPLTWKALQILLLLIAMSEATIALVSVAMSFRAVYVYCHPSRRHMPSTSGRPIVFYVPKEDANGMPPKSIELHPLMTSSRAYICELQPPNSPCESGPPAYETGSGSLPSYRDDADRESRLTAEN